MSRKDSNLGVRPMAVEGWLKKLDMAPKSKAHIAVSCICSLSAWHWRTRRILSKMVSHSIQLSQFNEEFDQHMDAS